MISEVLKVKVTEKDWPARDLIYPQGRGKDKA